MAVNWMQSSARTVWKRPFLFEQKTDMPAEKRIGYMESACKSQSSDDDEQPLNIQ